VPTTPDVAVVIPTRNRWDLLSSAALPAALGQEGVTVEVIVVDDGSTDVTSERVDAIDDSRLRLVRHEFSRGVAQARNSGIQVASASWVAFLDDDDLWAPDKLRLQLDATGEDTVFVYSGAAEVSDDRSWLYSLPPHDPQGLVRALLERNVLWGGCSNVLARTAALRAVGGFDENLFQLCDWDLWIRLALEGAAAARPETLVACVAHQRSMLLVTEDDVFAEFDYLEAKHKNASETYHVAFDRKLFTRWVALGHSRAGRRLKSAEVFLRGATQERDAGNVLRAFAALVGVRLTRPWARTADRDGRSFDPSQEPGWLELYRSRALASFQAMSKASSPTEA
jgi:glycosyltransferase involved in cell wall biosynthesis